MFKKKTSKHETNPTPKKVNPLAFEKIILYFYFMGILEIPYAAGVALRERKKKKRKKRNRMVNVLE